MSKVRDILVHACVEVAGRKRKCSRKPTKHSIVKGESCLVLKGGTYNAGKSYCSVCAQEILDVANGRMAELRGELGI